MTTEDLKQFASILNDYSKTIHIQNANKGFWTKRETMFLSARNLYGDEYAHYLIAADCVALTHGELSEGIEALRKPTFPITSTEKDSFGGEMADAVIRIMDLCAFFGINLGDAIVARAQHNSTRPHMHGGKIA